MVRVGKSFGDLTVLDEVDLEVRPGEKIAIIGPSGSGKSTLLRLLMTLDHPDSGTIEIAGTALGTAGPDGRYRPAGKAEIRRVRGTVGMVFQQFNLFPRRTALGNVIEAPIHVLGTPRDVAIKEGRRLLDRVGLSDRVDSYPHQMSGGEQQRVAIARALAMNPQVIMFDEVTSALDPERVEEVLEVIKELAEHSRMAILLVTHEMSFAYDVADRVVFMERGRVVEVGPPKQLFTAPESPRTREFLRSVLARWGWHEGETTEVRP